ncbi:MAG: aspartate kinase, partial [Myxococcota bacterium]
AIMVQKYGGSSVADLNKIKAVARKVVETRRRGYDVVVVVSAMGGTTDDLLEQARQINDTPERRELDMLLSVGERISMALLSMAIHSHGIDAISFTGSQSGIITTQSHSEARVVEVRPYRIQDELLTGKVVIVAGYQGVSYTREITTLGRGGSDTTAVALAAALGAEACEIYSDVDGIFSSDPRVVDSATKLATITYEEMQELARLGARVLNATAVEFARQAGIALYARSTHQSGSVGTTVHGGGGFRRVDGFEERLRDAEEGYGVTAISGLKRGLLLDLNPSPGQEGLLDRLLELIAPLDTPLCHLEPERGAVRILLNLDNIHDRHALEARLRARCGGALRLTDDVGLVAAVGQGVGNRPRVARAVVAALAAHNTAPLLVRASGPSVTCVLPSSQVQSAMQILHRALIDRV